MSNRSDMSIKNTSGIDRRRLLQAAAGVAGIRRAMPGVQTGETRAVAAYHALWG